MSLNVRRLVKITGFLYLGVFCLFVYKYANKGNTIKLDEILDFAQENYFAGCVAGKKNHQEEVEIDQLEINMCEQASMIHRSKLKKAVLR